MAKLSTYFKFKVTLLETEPQIWRSFIIKSKCSFLELHDTIQKAFGWMDYHLYEFREPDNSRSVAVSSGLDTGAYTDEYAPEANELLLDNYFFKEGNTCLYIYDFGDYWQHKVELLAEEQIKGNFRRKLTGGQRACPPEDCGGICGYEECVEVFNMTDEQISKLDEYRKEDVNNLKDWMDDWNPEEFDFDQTAKRLKRGVNKYL